MEADAGSTGNGLPGFGPSFGPGLRLDQCSKGIAAITLMVERSRLSERMGGFLRLLMDGKDWWVRVSRFRPIANSVLSAGIMG